MLARTTRLQRWGEARRTIAVTPFGLVSLVASNHERLKVTESQMTGAVMPKKKFFLCSGKVLVSFVEHRHADGAVMTRDRSRTVGGGSSGRAR
jgi:hypothetical protein